MTALLAGLVVIEPDFGTSMMLAVMFVVVVYTRRSARVPSGDGGAPALVLAAGLLIFVPWRLTRLVTFLDPWADPAEEWFQVVQSLIAVGSGGPNGLGFAQGKQKMLFLPFAHSDFIFCSHRRRVGFDRYAWRSCSSSRCFSGAACALRCWRRIVLGNCSHSIVTGIVAQALFNISVVLSLVPTKGIPLPFISYGGSSLVPTLAAVGILLNISQHAAGSVSLGILRTVSASRERTAVARRLPRGELPRPAREI